MSSYIDHRAVGWRSRITHSWRADFYQRLRWLYGDAYSRMTRPEARDDLMRWRWLGS